MNVAETVAPIEQALAPFAFVQSVSTGGRFGGYTFSGYIDAMRLGFAMTPTFAQFAEAFDQMIAAVREAGWVVVTARLDIPAEARTFAADLWYDAVRFDLDVVAKKS